MDFDVAFGMRCAFQFTLSYSMKISDISLRYARELMMF